MIRDLLDSPGISFSRSVYIGRGEIWLHPQRVELAKILGELLVTRLYRLSITTLGFMPKNGDLNELFFRTLAEACGERAKDLNVGVSLNLLNPYALRDEGKYAQDFMRTVKILKELGCEVYVLTMYDGDFDSQDRIAQLKSRAVRESGLDGEYIGNTLSPAGRAVDNYDFQSRPYVKGNKSHRCDYYGCKDEWGVWPVRGYDVQPDGSVALMCLRPGSHPHTFGNIYENDLQQIRTYRAVATKMLRRILDADQGRSIVCEIHRKAAISFQPPHSEKPLIRRVA
jgi:hypothetical protein